MDWPRLDRRSVDFARLFQLANQRFPLEIARIAFGTALPIDVGRLLAHLRRNEFDSFQWKMLHLALYLAGAL